MNEGKRPNCNIRPATPDDVPAIATILRGLGWFSIINDTPAAETETRVRRHLRLCLNDDSHMVLVAEVAGGAVLGYVAVHWLPYLILLGPEGCVS